MNAPATVSNTFQAKENLSRDRLWTIKDLALYLGRSQRWIWDALNKDQSKTGSIPFIRIPGGGRGQGSPRFVPDDIVEWVRQACPPAKTFQEWQELDRKKARKTQVA